MSEHLSQTQLAAYIERALHPGALLAIDNHLASCDVCHERLRGMIVPGAVKPADSSGGPFHLDYDQHLEPYVDGRVDDNDREIVDSHVALCSKCATDLRDLLAFKQQQPVPAIAGESRVTSAKRNQWLPQWALLSNPAWATAVAVMAVFVLGLPVLWWTTQPTSPSFETMSPEQRRAQGTGQPSPATSQTNPNHRDVPVPPREAPLLVLNDAGTEVIVNQRGHLEGLDGLAQDLRESVEQALTTRRLGVSPALTGWSTRVENLRGVFETPSTFAPVAPTNVVVETDRPTFRWRALAAALHYVVTIYDAKLRQVRSSGPISGTEWTMPNALERGVTYSWQISAFTEGETVVSPKPPLPEARFRILDQRALAALVKLKASAGTSHLAMGVFYWKHGLLEEAEHEFQSLATANPGCAVVRELLANVRRQRQ